ASTSQVNDVIDHIRAAFLISLDNETDTIPAGQLRLETKTLKQTERQLEAVGLFGVDVQADVVLLGEQGQRQQTRIQFFHHAFVLRAAVTRVQGGQLDRNARTLVDTATVGGFA